MVVVSNWGWPQWLIVVLTIIGEIRIFRANGRLALCGSFSFYLVDAVIFYYVVPAFGGMYDSIGWPQILFTALFVIDFSINAAYADELRVVQFWPNTLLTCAYLFLLGVGGFFA